MFFFGPKNPVFGPKLIFFVWDRVFWQSGARNPRRWFRFGTFGSILRFFVSELRPFSWGEPGRRAQKSYPTPLWGHRLPVTALALSARGPFGPARFARGLDKVYFLIRARPPPPPSFGQCPKENIFFPGRCSLTPANRQKKKKKNHTTVYIPDVLLKKNTIYFKR